MAGRLPVIAHFAAAWPPRAPGLAVAVLALQTAGRLVSNAAGFFLTGQPERRARRSGSAKIGVFC